MKYDLGKLGKGRIGVIGDFCLDVYWHADMTKSELSRETPHFPLPIVQERLSPGGAGNVVANLLALKPKKVEARDGWLRVEFDLDPIHEEANAARSAESEASSNQG